MHKHPSVWLAGLLALALIVGCSSSSSSSTFEPRFAWVLNEDDPSVSWYHIDADSGTPRHAGYLYLGDEADSVYDLALHPENDALYVSDPGGEQIHLLHVDPASGALRYGEALSTVDGSTPLPGGFSPYGLAISSDGRHLYGVLQSSLGVARIFSIDEADRSLTSGAISDELSTSSRELVLTPDQRHLYASLPDDGALGALALSPDGSTFEDDFIPDFEGLVVRDMAIDSNGQRLVAVGQPSLQNPGADTIQVYALDNGGQLALLNSISSLEADSVSVSPDGLRLFVSQNDAVHAYSFNPQTDSLTGHGSLVAPMNTDVQRAALDPSGQYLLAGTSGTTHGEALHIAGIEDLEPAGYNPRFGSIARSSPGRMVFSTGSSVRISATHLYVGDGSDGSDLVDRFVLDSQGRAGQREPSAVGENGIRDLAVHPYADALFSANEGTSPDNGRLMVFGIDETGAPELPALDVIEGGALQLDPLAVAVSPGGQHVYTAGGDRFHRRTYDTENREFGAGDFPVRAFTTTGMTIDPSGRFLLEATDEDDGRLRRSRLAADNGELISSITRALDDVVDLAVTADGATVIAISNNAGSPEIRAWSISAFTGTLTENNTRDLPDPGVAVALHPTGRWAYVVSQRDTGGATGDSTLALRVFPVDSDGQVAEAVFEDEWTDTWRINMHSVAVHPAGHAVYAGTSDNDSSTGTLRVYRMDADDGAALAGPDLIDTVNIPAALAVQPGYQ